MSPRPPSSSRLASASSWSSEPAWSSIAAWGSPCSARTDDDLGDSYDLPVATLPGQYAVRAQLASGWHSQTATITVSLTALGLLYLCSTP